MAITVEKKYGILRSITVLLKILAILVLVFGIIAGIAAMVGSAAMHATDNSPEPAGTQMMMGGFAGGFLIVIWGIVGGIALWAWAELINLLVDVEENTRKTYILLERGRD